MNLYNNQNKILNPVKEKPFKLEKEIQVLFERNLDKILRLELVRPEFFIKGKKIDTLAFDRRLNAFAIIEYKKDKNFSVFDQGIGYLNLMLQNKGEFTSEYNETICGTGKYRQLNRGRVNWLGSKIIFISPGFTETQIRATDFKDLSIELVEVKQYENGIVSIMPLKKSSYAVSIRPVVSQEENYTAGPTEELHLKSKPEDIKKLYNQYRTAILKLQDKIAIKPKRWEIGFISRGKIITDICIQRDILKMWINLKRGQLRDPKKLTRDVSKLRHWGNGDYEIRIKDTKNLEYIMGLVKEAIPLHADRGSKSKSL
ncbi:MAG TPA: DUF5655 domain-containing protein [Ignavibacteria bacterium]|jgi:predicted transport protein